MITACSTLSFFMKKNYLVPLALALVRLILNLVLWSINKLKKIKDNWLISLGGNKHVLADQMMDRLNDKEIETQNMN